MIPDIKHLKYLRIPLIRVGECDACAKTYPRAHCCTDLCAIDLVTTVLDPHTEHYMRMRGIVVAPDHRIRFDFSQPCATYDPDTRRCKAYDNRPIVCREFPAHPGQIWYKATDNTWFKYCSYDFDLDKSRDIEIDLPKLAEEVNDRLGLY